MPSASIVELAHRLAAGEPIDAITDLRGTVFTRKARLEGWVEIDSTHLDTPGPLNPPIDPYAMDRCLCGRPAACQARMSLRRLPPRAPPRQASHGAAERATPAPRVQTPLPAPRPKRSFASSGA